MRALNKKGNVSGTVMVIMIVCALIITAIYPMLISSTQSVKSVSSEMDEAILNRTIWERLKAVFSKNPSHSENIIFADLDNEYTINNISFEYTPHTTGDIIIGAGTSKDFDFDIYNATDISVKIDKLSTYDATNYKIEILHEGISIYEKTTEEMVTDLVIPETYLYNNETAETRYGQYTIRITTDGTDIKTNITYQHLDKRKIEVIDNFKKGFFITMMQDEDNNINVRRVN